MNRFVPTDLLEIPAVNYFRYRNRGKVDDFNLSKKFIQTYMPFYGKDPRKFFLLNQSSVISKPTWTKETVRGPFLHSTGYTQTPYRPLSPILQEEKYSPVLHMVTQRYLSKNHNGKKRPDTVVLFVHGFAEESFKLQEQGYFRLFNHTFHSDIFALELPYHFHRQPSDSPFSGAYYLNGNPIRMLESIRQSIQEIMHLVNIIKQNYSRVILFGISLGGHLIAMVSQFLKEVDIIAALASPFLFRLNPRIVPISSNIVNQIKLEGHTDYYKILYATNLKYFSPHTTNRNTTIIGGRYDRIVPFSQVMNLAKMLEKPLFAYPGGHVSIIFWLHSLLHQINDLFQKKE
jgi:pimeloyl-ACP methyl ester carboxylesterase